MEPRCDLVSTLVVNLLKSGHFIPVEICHRSFGVFGGLGNNLGPAHKILYLLEEPYDKDLAIVADQGLCWALKTR